MAAAKVRLLPRAARELAALPDPIQERLLQAVELLADLPHLGVAMVGSFQSYGCLLAHGGCYWIIYNVVGCLCVDIAWFRYVRG